MIRPSVTRHASLSSVSGPSRQDHQQQAVSSVYILLSERKLQGNRAEWLMDGLVDTTITIGLFGMIS